jgi:hypothetical protein
MSLPWRVRIPPQYYAGFARLVGLSDEVFQGLVHGLRTTPLARSTGALVSQVSQTAGIASDDVDALVEVLISLYILRADMELPVPEFVDVVVRALQDLRREDLKPADGDWSPFKDRLSALLKFDDSLGIISKATTLGSEYDHSYLRSHIVTDLRPVFANDPHDRPTAALITHTLRLSYSDGTDRKDFFITMEPADLDELRAQLNRADAKGKSLEALLEAAQVRLLKEEGE